MKAGLWRSVAALAVLASVATPCLAAEGDPCGKPAGSDEGERWRAGVDRDVGLYIAKHLQRACRRLSTYPGDPHAEDLRERIDELRGRLAGLVLDPVYERFPDLRDRDLSDVAVPVLEDDLSTNRQPFVMTVQPHAIDRDSAAKLIDLTKEATKRAFALVGDLNRQASRQQVEVLIEATFDIASEIGFADGPAYAAYPELRLEEMRRPSKDDLRTDESDTAFRKRAISPRSVRFTRSARARMRRFLIALRYETQREQVLSIQWTLGGRLKGPNDAEAKRLPPGVSLGAYPMSRLPPDVIARVGHLPLYLAESEPGLFEGKTIDYRDGQFVLEQR